MKTSVFRQMLGLMAATAVLVPIALAAQISPRNILLVLADEIGTDALSLFNTNRGTNVSFAPTPNINALAQQGVIFRNCYAYPSCSPTRSAILTGRYGFRTGIGAAIADPGDPYLSPRDFTMAKALSANPQLGIRHAHVGKWHLSTNAIDPNFIGGWNHFSGFLAGEQTSYYNWEKTVNGTTTLHYTNYATSDNATDAINWIKAQGTNRWFLWFAPKAAHAPYNKPPNELHGYDYLPPVVGTNDVRPYWEAMIESLDTELGRVLTNVSLAETMVVFLGDNGTPSEVIQPPYDQFHCKGTLTEGGVRVPMFITGAGVVSPNRSTTAVVHAVDLFATLLESAGVNLATTLPTNLVFDSRSFAAAVRDEPWNPIENVILTENFGAIIPPGLRGVAARGQRYKLIQLDNGPQAFYDLQGDPYESTNLLGMPNNLGNLTVPQRTAYAGLTNRLAGGHNYPAAPSIVKWEAQAGALTLTVPEQLGIAYELARASVVEATNWTVVTNYVRTVRTNAALVTLSDPTPAARGFYRVTAAGR
jgi:arylsulfatase A-like enzyme